MHWDRETYPYLVAVDWAEGGPLITVLRRMQQHGLVLAVDPRTGETQVHAELADPRWVEPVPGTPCHLPDGRVLVGGELAHDGYDARCLFADGTLLTPPSLYVRRVVGRLPGPARLAGPAGRGERRRAERAAPLPGAHGDRRRRRRVAQADHRARLAHRRGRRRRAGRSGAASLDHAGVRLDRVAAATSRSAELRSLAATPPYAPRPTLDRVTDRRLPAAVLYPAAHVAGRRLPVLLDVYGGPGTQQVRATRAAWLERQWWADAGFAVVTVDNRGTPGVAPSFEKVIHRRLADVILTDQVDALAALAGKHPDLDLERVAIRGRGLRRLAGRAGARCAARTCSGARSRARRSPTGRCATRRTPSATWACPATPRTCTRTTRWWSSPVSR